MIITLCVVCAHSEGTRCRICYMHFVSASSNELFRDYLGMRRTGGGVRLRDCWRAYSNLWFVNLSTIHHSLTRWELSSSAAWLMALSVLQVYAIVRSHHIWRVYAPLMCWPCCCILCRAARQFAAAAFIDLYIYLINTHTHFWFSNQHTICVQMCVYRNAPMALCLHIYFDGSSFFIIYIISLLICGRVWWYPFVSVCADCILFYFLNSICVAGFFKIN